MRLLKLPKVVACAKKSGSLNTDVLVNPENSDSSSYLAPIYWLPHRLNSCQILTNFWRCDQAKYFHIFMSNLNEGENWFLPGTYNNQESWYRKGANDCGCKYWEQWSRVLQGPDSTHPKWKFRELLEEKYRLLSSFLLQLQWNISRCVHIFQAAAVDLREEEVRGQQNKFATFGLIWPFGVNNPSFWNLLQKWVLETDCLGGGGRTFAALVEPGGAAAAGWGMEVRVKWWLWCAHWRLVCGNYFCVSSSEDCFLQVYSYWPVWCKLVCGSNGDFGARTNVSSAEILFDIVLPWVYLDRPQSLYCSFLRNLTAKLDWILNYIHTDWCILVWGSNGCSGTNIEILSACL